MYDRPRSTYSSNLMSIVQNMQHSNLSDLLRRFSDRNVFHGREKRRKTWKYLREDWHHRIKCTTTTLLATFMWRRRLYSATLANATHREVGKVADGTRTQVKVQMINRWRVKMIQKGLYKVGDSPRKRGEKGERKRTIQQFELFWYFRAIIIHTFNLLRLKAHWDKHSCLVFSCHTI